MPVVQSHEIHIREDFPLLCNWRLLYDGAVEVGVDTGNFSDIFLARWYGNEFYGVDNYITWSELNADRTMDKVQAASKYAKYGSRCRLLGITSAAAANWFTGRGQFLDFVYIDAEHDEHSATQDMDLWWPRVSAKGILAGHDYDSSHPGVIAAVNRFAQTHDATVYLTHETLASWYIYKSGIPGPDWQRLPQ